MLSACDSLLIYLSNSGHKLSILLAIWRLDLHQLQLIVRLLKRCGLENAMRILVYKFLDALVTLMLMMVK